MYVHDRKMGMKRAMEYHIEIEFMRVDETDIYNTIIVVSLEIEYSSIPSSRLHVVLKN